MAARTWSRGDDEQRRGGAGARGGGGGGGGGGGRPRGQDPMKERLFGLTNSEGNHGEDVKELYYYLDATPTHSYLKMLYKYPQREFPYARLVEENRRRGKARAGVRAARHRHLRRRPLLRRVRRVRQGRRRTTS